MNGLLTGSGKGVYLDVKPYNFDSLPLEVEKMAAEAGIDSAKINRNFNTFAQCVSLLRPDLIQPTQRSSSLSSCQQPTHIQSSGPCTLHSRSRSP